MTRIAQRPRPINRSGDYTNMLRWRAECDERTHVVEPRGTQLTDSGDDGREGPANGL